LLSYLSCIAGPKHERFWKHVGDANSQFPNVCRQLGWGTHFNLYAQGNFRRAAIAVIVHTAELIGKS
jgi:hypothetical protein